jgi:hypothetical protein
VGIGKGVSKKRLLFFLRLPVSPHASTQLDLAAIYIMKV